jgi:poly-gamma-glutamate capsule biosynthesis protein CapA/YwtB (metallophosphatase superfamily)
LWRARCSVMGTPGSAGGPRERTGRNVGTAPRADPTEPRARNTMQPSSAWPRRCDVFYAMLHNGTHYRHSEPAPAPVAA